MIAEHIYHGMDQYVPCTTVYTDRFIAHANLRYKFMHSADPKLGGGSCYLISLKPFAVTIAEPNTKEKNNVPCTTVYADRFIVHGNLRY